MVTVVTEEKETEYLGYGTEIQTREIPQRSIP